jgi:hypothetical protein
LGAITGAGAANNGGILGVNNGTVNNTGVISGTGADSFGEGQFVQGAISEIECPDHTAALSLFHRLARGSLLILGRWFRKACVFSDTQRALESRYPQVFSLD